jgi:hypothetical protein
MPVRARDLRTNIKDYGFEKGVVATIEAMLEEQGEMRQHLREAVEMLAMFTDRLSDLHLIANGMQNKMDQMRREQEHGDENA